MSSSSRAPGDPVTRQRICTAALRLISKSGGADVTLAQVAKAARVSRQALYLHFADRAALFLAVVRHADEQRGIPQAVRELQATSSGLEAIRYMVAMQARLNPGIWPLARLLESVRRHDAAAERSWQNRLEDRLHGCRAIVVRLQTEGTMREHLDPAVAADMLWSLTSLRAWEDLVLERGWTAKEYEERVSDALLRLLTRTAPVM